MAMLHEETSSLVIKAFYQVYNTLGYGFLEKVYENAMMLELKKSGLKAAKQESIKVYYKEELVGEYYADILVENKIIKGFLIKIDFRPFYPLTPLKWRTKRAEINFIGFGFPYLGS